MISFIIFHSINGVKCLFCTKKAGRGTDVMKYAEKIENVCENICFTFNFFKILSLVILAQKDVALPNPECWGELFDFCPTFNTCNFSYSRTKVYCLYQLIGYNWWNKTMYMILLNTIDHGWKDLLLLFTLPALGRIEKRDLMRSGSQHRHQI